MTINKDIDLWQTYKITKSVPDRAALLKNMDGLIQNYVNKWAGPIPRDILLNEARSLAIKAFDTYDPGKGVLLSTHVMNNLLPLSRMVYSHQNTIRIPENLVMKLNSYNQAKDHLLTLYGRNPTTDELHQHTGYPAKEIAKFEQALSHNLIESAGEVSGDFFSSHDDEDADLMQALYMDLNPEEKVLFEYITGFNHKPRLNTPDMLKALNITQAQLSYKKTLLTQKIHRLLNGFNRV